MRLLKASFDPNRFIRAHISVKIGIIIVLIYLSFLAAAKLLIDADGYIEKVIAELEKASGGLAKVGVVNMELLPVPSIVVSDIRLHNGDDLLAEQYMLTTGKIRVGLNPWRLLALKVAPGKVTVESAEFDVIRFMDGTTNWDFVKDIRHTNLKYYIPSSIYLLRGKIIHEDKITNTVQEIEDIFFELGLGEHIRYEGSFNADSKLFQADGELSAITSATQMFDGTIHLRHHDTKLTYEGKIGFHGIAEGHASLQSDDIHSWLEYFFRKEKKQGLFDAINKNIPLSIEADILYGESQLGLKNFLIEMKGVKGGGEIIRQDGGLWKLRMDFDSLLLDGVIADKQPEIDDKLFNSFFGKLIPKHVTADIHIKARDVGYENMVSKVVTLSASLDDGEIVVSQAVARFPGNTNLLAFGIFKQNIEGVVNFDGNLELLGENLGDFMKGVGSDVNRFLTSHTAAFRARANISLSKRQSIFSDIKFQAGELLLAGGASVSREAKYDAEMTFRIKGLKADQLASLIIPKSEKDALGSAEFGEVERRIVWLDKLRSRLLINLIVQDYELDKMTGSRATMAIVLGPGEFQLRDLSMDVGGINYKGNVSYSQRNSLVPKTSADISISELDINPFVARNLRRTSIPRGNRESVWPKEYFNFSFLKGYNADLRISIDKLIHKSFPMRNAVLLANAENGQWTIEELSGNIWDGSMRIQGTFDVSSIPTVNIGYVFGSIRADRLFYALAGHENFHGKLSLSGTISASGVSMHNWIKNMSGSAIARGEDIAIKGFDLSSLVQAVHTMRSVSDVISTARIAMFKNRSTFSVVEGGIQMEGGVVKLHDLKLRSRHAVGTVRGEVYPETWQMNLSINFSLVSLRARGGDYPSLQVLIKDSMDDPVSNLNTYDLQSFIAKRKLR